MIWPGGEQKVLLIERNERNEPLIGMGSGICFKAPENLLYASLKIPIADVTIGANIILVSWSVIRSDCISRQDNGRCTVIATVVLHCFILFTT